MAGHELMAKVDPEVLAHLEWLGFVQPTGLVVSAPALVRGGAILDRRDAIGQESLRSCLDPDAPEDEPKITDFEQFARDVLGWSFSVKGFAGTDDSPIPTELHVALPDYGETLAPDFAVRELNPGEGMTPWQLLVTTVAPGTDLDKTVTGAGLLEASPHSRMERLLRDAGVPAGLLFNGTNLRLISAPRGESSGWLQFEVKAMTQTAGRPICTAMRLLLGQQRLLVLPKDKRLAALLDDSRKFQNEVSDKLAEQVLHALYELLRGFQAAHDASGAELLREPLDDDPDQVYRALLTVVLRLVFLLYAEEREMLPTHDEAFGRYYSLAGLFSRLRDHAAQYPDTMDQRYGAWAQLLVLFRMVHDGADAGEVRLPPRHGGLFDPDRYRFLEGRPQSGARQTHERIEPPRVPDGTIFRALEKLLVLDGERLSYRALDVEQIGSVYQTMMGFRLETAAGQSLALKPKQKSGAPTAVNLDELLAIDPGRRGKHIKDTAERDLPAKVATALKEAATITELHGALDPVVDRNASPDLLPTGAMLLQPSDERRKSGSHYTPRALTEPIVRTTLKPILERLRGEGGEAPTPAQILDLKVCDPAMGSAAFLVEACRQLGDALVDAWQIHGGRPELPADEGEVVFARRLVAQRCLYGLDRNPVAVDLAKMSLWLATLARDHAFTFLDHALRAGDALVGLTRHQIEAFHWDETRPPLAPIRIAKHMQRVVELRAEIRAAGEAVSDFALRDMWDEARTELDEVRLFGDLAVLAFFSGAKPKDREAKRAEYLSAVTNGPADHCRWMTQQAREADRPVVPFHWGIEFPEVFQRELPGFDAFIGNPPFAGKNTLLNGNPGSYLDWLKLVHEGSHGNADLVAHFFRRAFAMLRPFGSLGFLATNTIRQGDTRSTSLQWICENGGSVYAARRRIEWPGLAAVTVSAVHITNGPCAEVPILDGKPVSVITAFLFHEGPNSSPIELAANARRAYQGFNVLGVGFTFDDEDTSGLAWPTSDVEVLCASDPANRDAIFPYIGGKEINDSPTLEPRRHVIYFGDLDRSTAASRFPELFARVEARVKPVRASQKRKALRERWWQFAEKRPELFQRLQDADRVVVISAVTAHLAFAVCPSTFLFSHNLNVLIVPEMSGFAILQSRVHELWAGFTSSTLEDRRGYRPTDSFDTFPFPAGWQTNDVLELAGIAYEEFRGCVMATNGEGLTKTYNRFHDPADQTAEIAKLRALHAEIDRAVLDAYQWTDIPTDCDFFLDYEVVDDGVFRRKKPWRYRWPDDVHDEVLARLLVLNSNRAADEQRSGSALSPSKRADAAPASRQTEGLF
ncbi:MAG: Eco57I restriction-modification methylase domain-containing protein [Solirubrobacteraceae bacterium]